MADFDSQKREALVSKLEGHDYSVSPPLVSLEDFFDGNYDYASIGCNLLADKEHPGPQGFYAILKAIRECLEVQDVLIEIYEAPRREWPFSERVYIVARASVAEVEKWMASLCPSEIDEGYDTLPFAPPEVLQARIPEGQLYSAWWD